MDILLIDDEAGVREPLGTFLAEKGHRVRTAGNGEEGLWMLEERPAELVISDIKMPGLSGIEVLRRVRQRWPAAEVVLATGYGTMDDAVEALRLGAYDFLIKPVRLTRVELLVRHCEERIQFSRDNRELRQVVERLRELNERKEKFIALANHEIRTPTTVAAGLVSLLVSRPEQGSRENRQLLLTADRALRRLKEMVEDLGDLGLAQYDGLSPRALPHLLGDLLENVGDLCEMYGSLREVRIDVRSDADPGLEVVVDRRKILRALGALIQNAVKYTPDGGEVTVSAHVDGVRLNFEISDTGVGVAEDEREKIFEAFYESADVRYHKSSGHEFGGGGLGIGLPLALAIARAHGGGLEYRPRSGGGSVFVLALPLRRPLPETGPWVG